MELERAKQELQETRTEVARLESVEKGDSAATTIQSAARARKARIELERRKLAVIQQQEQIAQREVELVEKQEGKYIFFHCSKFIKLTLFLIIQYTRIKKERSRTRGI